MNDIQKLMLDAMDLEQQQRNLTSRLRNLMQKDNHVNVFILENYPTLYTELTDYPRNITIRRLEMAIREMNSRMNS